MSAPQDGGASQGGLTRSEWNQRMRLLRHVFDLVERRKRFLEGALRTAGLSRRESVGAVALVRDWLKQELGL